MDSPQKMIFNRDQLMSTPLYRRELAAVSRACLSHICLCLHLPSHLSYSTTAVHPFIPSLLQKPSYQGAYSSGMVSRKLPVKDKHVVFITNNNDIVRYKKNTLIRPSVDFGFHVCVSVCVCKVRKLE